MPLYEFYCKPCDIRFEELRKIDDFDTKCPVCDGEVEKLMSAANAVVIGSTNRSIDTIIGDDAAKRWSNIQERKNLRDKTFGHVTEKEINAKNGRRISSLLNRQKGAYSVIDKAKKEAGITKNQEISHLLKG